MTSGASALSSRGPLPSLAVLQEIFEALRDRGARIVGVLAVSVRFREAFNFGNYIVSILLSMSASSWLILLVLSGWLDAEGMSCICFKVSSVAS